MKRLYSPKVVKEIIDLYDFNFKKSLGQNFLIDKNFVDKIVDAADIKDQNVLEIGPGIGTITYEMAKIAKKVVAIEIDQTLIPILKENLSEFENAKVIKQAILKTDLKANYNRLTLRWYDHYGTKRSGRTYGCKRIW